MSAQAVLSATAPAGPATPQGPSGGKDASGFRGLLAGVLSPGDDPGSTNDAGSPDLRRAAPGGRLQVGAKVGDESSEQAVIAAAADAISAEPEAEFLPEATPVENGEPGILLTDPAAEEPDPQVLSGMVHAADSNTALAPESAPVVLTPEVSPQLPPAATAGKSPPPQVLPATPPAEASPPVPTGNPAEDAPSILPEIARSSAGGAGTPPVQPASPPLRALTDRTSKPLDETPSDPAATPVPAKSTAPATSLSAPSDQAAKPAHQTTPTPAALQADVSAPPPDEGHSSGGASSGQTEVAPARDHSLSTLSRASIDATAQIAAQIQRKLEGRSTRFEIALRPAELGRVDVKLEIDAEGRLAARLAFDNPAAATDLRGRVDDLRRQLEAAGFELADDAFEFAERDSGSSAFDRGQDSRNGHNRAFAAAARLKAELDLAQPPQWLGLSLSPSGVDMKV